MASLNMMGERTTDSWEPTSETECIVAFEGDSAAGALNGEELSLAVEGKAENQCRGSKKAPQA